jgi:5-methylcytosine-specific restriction enzyme subunit McrC
MTDISLREWGPPETVAQLEPGAAEALRTVLKVTRTASGGWVLKPKGKVGVVRVGDLTVRIRPKVTTAHLMFLVGYANKMIDWREALVDVSETADLVATVADAYSRLAERALAAGVLSAYRSVEATLPVLKGRLRAAAQLRSRPGAALPLEVAYQEFGVDAVENRLLRAAAWQALRLPRLWPETERRLRRILHTLTGVSPLGAGGGTWTPSRLNRHYHAALGLAEMIRRGSSFDLPRGPIQAEGFVLDMDRVFENFLCTALGERLGRRTEGTWAAPFVGHLDHADTFKIKPDFAWLVNGRPVSLVDAKYKADGGNHPEDLYQMLSYCSVLAVPTGHLVYARGEVGAHDVRGSGVRIRRHRLDLSLAPAELLAVIDHLADHVVREAGLVPIPGGIA